MSDRHKTRKPMIWIVDDSPTEAALTERALGERYRFERFDDGSQMVERLGAGAEQPDLLLLDWVMPQMSGGDVCRFLRGDPSTADLPIIIVTASRVETSDVVHGLALGANDYVARPFATEELRARVDAAIRAKQFRDAAARERARLATVAELGRALVETSHDLDRVLDTFARTLTRELCDGCAIRTLPGALRGGAVWHQRGADAAPELKDIANLADPGVRAFETPAEALTLPAAYHPYIHRFGLRGLAILPFPTRSTVQAAVTVTRAGTSPPFDAQDIETLETCIEYTAMAVENALRFEAERAARGQLDEILANLPLGILVASADGVITFRNSVAVELVNGASHVGALDDAIASPPTDRAGPGPLAAVVARGMAGEVVLGGDVEIAAARGRSRRIVRVSVVPLRDRGGLVESVVVVLEDVTSARAMAAERERIAGFQEHMLAIVGHDIRSPIQVITMAAAQLARHTRADAGAGKLLQRVDTSARRIGRIVDQLLDVTRARVGGGIPVQPRDVDLLAVTRTIVDELSVAHPRSRIAVKAPPEPVRGTWDPDRLAQVVSNLVANAIQHGPESGPVTVEIGRTERTATLAVTNGVRGAPIPATALRAIFDPFRRGRNAAHDGGLGLGLYIVHEIVRAYAGTITAESSEAGTTFRVELPFASPGPSPGA